MFGCARMAGHRNKDVSFVSSGGDRTGVICFSPGFSPLLSCPGLLFFCSSYTLQRLPGTRSAIVNLTWSYSATDLRSGRNAQITARDGSCCKEVFVLTGNVY